VVALLLAKTREFLKVELHLDSLFVIWGLQGGKCVEWSVRGWWSLLRMLKLDEFALVMCIEKLIRLLVV
jgi:hypothetical protein